MSSTSILPVAADQFQIRPDLTFLNHGSFGACPRPVFEIYQEWQRRLEADPIEFLGRRIDELLQTAREALAPYLGTRAEHIVFVKNATFGTNIVARSLMQLLKPGDEVLATDHEYGAADRTWRFLCAQHGITYRNQPIPVPLASAEEMIEQLWQGVTPRTRIIFISHITSPTALIFPVERICQRAREAGIITVIDGAHAPGHVPLSLDALGVDFYTGNCHKWLCAPKGSAFLYARPERQALLQPLIVSWGWESRTPSDSPFQDVFGWAGTEDPAAYLSVPAAIAFQQEHNWDAVRQACHELVSEARRRITTLLGSTPLCSDDSRWWGQMCAIPLPDCTDPMLQQRLRDEWKIEIPISGWNQHCLLRISLQGYNSPADIERLYTALEALFTGSM
jgi:isopenicillin-N epimerase